MSKIINPNEQDSGIVKTMTNPMHRRSFFKYIGAGAALSTLVIAGCNNDDDGDDPDLPAGPMAVNLGSGDVGILNYAFALEQLEAAFYAAVVGHSAFNTTFSSALERSVLTDIRDHEIAHREFFRAAIPAANRIPDLTPNFDGFNLADRTLVLNTAKTFEDLGVAAYNGAGKLFTDTGNGLVYLTLAGKIVSVEARHAAEIRDIISNGTFASGPSGIIAGRQIVDANGLDVALMPAQVLPLAAPFIKNTINASGLPTA